MRLIFFLLIVCFNASAQSLDSALFAQVNQARGKRHQLVYDSTRQKALDKFTQTKTFARMVHSSLPCGGEIMAMSYSPDTFMKQWKESPKHRRILHDRSYRRMVCRVVEVKPGRYIGIVQFFSGELLTK